MANRRKPDGHITAEEIDELFHESFESLRLSAQPASPEDDPDPGERGRALSMVRRPDDLGAPPHQKAGYRVGWDLDHPPLAKDTWTPCPHCRFANETIDFVCGRCDRHLVRWPSSGSDLHQHLVENRHLFRNGGRLGVLLVALGIGFYRWEWVVYPCLVLLFLLFVGTLLRAHKRARREMIIQATTIFSILGLGYYALELQSVAPITTGQFVTLSLPVVLVVLYARMALGYGKPGHRPAHSLLSSIGQRRFFAVFPVTIGLLMGTIVLRLVDRWHEGTILAPYLGLAHAVLVGTLVVVVIAGGVVAGVANSLRYLPATRTNVKQPLIAQVLLEMLRVAHDGITVSAQLANLHARAVVVPFSFLVLAGVSAATFSSNLAVYLWSGSPTLLPTLALAFVGLIGSTIGTVASYSGIGPRRVTMTVLRGLPSPRAGEIALYVALPFSLHTLSGLMRTEPDRIGAATVVAGAIVIVGLVAVFVQTRPGGSPAASDNGVAHDFAVTAVPRFAIVSSICGWLLVAGSRIVFDSSGVPAAGAARTEAEHREVAVTASITSFVSRLVSGVAVSLPGPASVSPESNAQASPVPATLDEPADHALATPVPVEVDKPIVDTILTARPAESGKTVTVGPGETLRTIARREYGDQAEWERIYKENKSRIDNPDILPLGLDLFIPERE